MIAEAPPAWNLFKQIFAEHWNGFTRVHPRYQTPYYDGLVDKMLGCGDPEKIGYIEYRCLQCGEGKHRVAMSCKSSLCLRCAKVYVDNWVSQVSQMLHAGVIYRHIVLTMPAMLRPTFYQQSKGFCRKVRFLGLDHGVGHFQPLSITRQRHLLVYHYIAMSHEGLCQVF